MSAVSCDVFTAFPYAVVKDRWKLGEVRKSTITGNNYTESEDFLDVIVVEGFQEKTDSDTIAESVSETVLYAKPAQLPTEDLEAYLADYLFHDTKRDSYYSIKKADAGKNQQNGVLEHVEFVLNPTSISEV